MVPPICVCTRVHSQPETAAAPHLLALQGRSCCHRVSASSPHGLVWVGRDLSRPSSPVPCHGQGHLQPGQGPQSPVQPGLEWFQGWGISHLAGQPGPGSQSKKVLSSSWNLPSLSLKPSPLVPSLQALLKSLSPAFLQALFTF